MIRQYELVDTVRSYDPGVDENALNRAYVYAMKMHGAQKRASGDPYFAHPLEVAGILTKYRLDTQTIITALLHDTVEDTRATLEEIEDLFGNEVANMVDGVTKLSQIEVKSEHAKQAANFQKLLLALSGDIRVLLVKLADRLHNMRTLHFIRKPEKRLRIAQETLEIYGPLAERIGMEDIRDELFELSFAEINPQDRNAIIKSIEYLHTEGTDLVQKICQNLTDLLKASGLDAQVTGREKRPYSIWKKMKRKDLTLANLSDIVAFRICVQTPPECYQVLGVVHGTYPMVPLKFKDYISTPKSNGYQSLHTTVMVPDAQRIEVQIRTHEMHESATMGVAAHWLYKQKPKDGDIRPYRWIRDLLDVLENSATPEEFLEQTKIAMFDNRVFCFTPQGDLIDLPHGATVIDFAYAIHTTIGHTCVDCRVNGRNRPLNTPLQTGDQVRIIHDRKACPQPAWQYFAVTVKARSAIRRFINQQKRHDLIQKGRTLICTAFRDRGYTFTERDVLPYLHAISHKTGHVFDTIESVCEAIGRGQISSHGIEKILSGDLGDLPSSISLTQRESLEKIGVSIERLKPDMRVVLASCCAPLPGEQVVGHRTSPSDIVIHKTGCLSMIEHMHNPDHLIEVTWDESLNTCHVARLNIAMENIPGALADVTQVVAQAKSNITNLAFVHRTQNLFETHLDIEVKSINHLTEIMARLKTRETIEAVSRIHV